LLYSALLVATNVQLLFVCTLLRSPHTSTLFPYTTLFRSDLCSLAFDQQIGNQVCVGNDQRSLRRARSMIDCVRGEIVDRCRHKLDRKSTRLNSSHVSISYAVFCLKKKKKKKYENYIEARS